MEAEGKVVASSLFAKLAPGPRQPGSGGALSPAVLVCAGHTLRVKYKHVAEGNGADVCQQQSQGGGRIPTGFPLLQPAGQHMYPSLILAACELSSFATWTSPWVRCPEFVRTL